MLAPAAAGTVFELVDAVHPVSSFFFLLRKVFAFVLAFRVPGFTSWS